MQYLHKMLTFAKKKENAIKKNICLLNIKKHI